MQLQAGYILDFVKNKLLSDNNQLEVKSLLDFLCYFEVDGLLDSDENTTPELAVTNNLLSRGLPTRPNLFVEKEILRALQLGEVVTNTLGDIIAIPHSSFDSVSQYLYKSLHIVDPRIHPSRNRYELEPSFEFANIGSQYEEDFLLRLAPRILGDEWFQLLESQREFTSIVNLDNNFTRQRTDFTVEFPFPINNKKGIVIEIDGFHHWENNNQRILDEQRDAEVLRVDWMNTLRIETRNFDRIEQQLYQLKELSRQKYFNTLRQNFQTPLYNDRNGLIALQLILTPFAIARIKKTINQLLISNQLELYSQKWNIAVIERDVPCAALAFTDLKLQIENLFALQGKVVSPDIELTVYTNPEFSTSQINQIDYSKHFSKIRFVNSEYQDKEVLYDVLIDISVLQRKGFSGFDSFPNARVRCIVRSSHHKHSIRTFLTSNIIEYKELVTYNPNNIELSIFDNSSVQTLRVFLQDIFRKNTFREGQPEILSKALQGESVIGLLPTGGGKSLTYQLASMLQPGICLVIDPIKSLMRDQFDNLNKNQIDACNFINSSLKTREQKTKESSKLKNGEVLVTFISPERLQMKEFRDILQEMQANGIYFNYCVIDEAHCVSEWGHDFRTSYLSLGKNAIEFCKTKNKDAIPLFGLTATASFDVLSDVQRELSGNNERNKLKEDSIIRYDTVNREELSYEIIDINADLRDTDNEWKLKEKLGTAKQSVLIDELGRLSFDKQCKYSGIIFCPHRGWYFGVTDRYRKDDKRNAVYDAIQRAAIPNVYLGSFMGSDSDDEKIAEIIEAESIQAQEDFINNKLNLLVSTKAFGMGIDKPNIRFTYHVNYPSSIESFVQESGRAGRDKKPAKCYILFNDEQIYKGDNVSEIDRDNLLYFHNSSFKGVEKEKAVLFELLSAIHTPNKLFDIEVKLYEHFQQEIKLQLWQSPAGYWYLFVNGESFEDKFGAVKIPSLDIDTNRATRPIAESNRVLSFVSQYIQQNYTGDKTEWLKSSTTIAGLETLLQVNDKIELTIRFENNITERIEIISKWLKAAFTSGKFDTIVTKEILSFSNSFDDFKNQVVTKINNGRSFEETAQMRDNAKQHPLGTSERELQRLFNGFRVKSDTEKALYRLSIIGVIDDYTVDFNSKTYKVTASRKHDQQYFKNLENYIRKYYSEVRTKQEIRKSKHFEGVSSIQKCLFFLTDFVYREIEKKRFEGIAVMKEACEIGKESGGDAFKEFVDLYFNSKYARKGYEVNGQNKSLTDRTEEGKQQNIKWVWEFIDVLSEDISGSEIDNIKHMRGACVRLLIPQPDNAVFHLLKAFSIFILEPENQRLMDEASNSFSKGFIEFQKVKEWSFNEVLVQAEKFKNYVLQFSTHPSIQEIMQNQMTILSVKVHSEWLELFNQKFLKNYESRYSYTS